MVDLQTVCCMCGDVGFPDKLFRCSKCHNRFQHSYCSNYYSDSLQPIEQCDWCQSEERSVKQGGSKKSPSGKSSNYEESSSEFSGHRSSEKGKNPATGTPSPRPSIRRYKLLKDVMC